MSMKFFAGRFLAAACVAFAVLLVAELLKGHAMRAALGYAATWGAITALVYVGALAYRLRRAAACSTRAPRSESA